MARRGNSLFRIALLAGTATLLGVGAWIWLGGGVNPAALKASMSRSVQRATGRAFSIDGPLHVTMGLAPSITADNIRFANVPGGSRPDMLTARAVKAEVALLPLLRGQVVVESVTLVNPDILLENGPDGTPNWQFHAARPSLFRGTDEGGGPHGSSQPVDIRELHIDGGHIAITAPNIPRIAADIGSATIHAENGATMRGDIAGQADGVPFTAAITAGSFDRLQGGPATALAGAWPLTVKIDAGGGELKLDGGINHPDELRGYGFLVTGNTPDLGPLAPWLPKPLALPMKDVNFTVRLTDGANGEFRTTGLSLHAGSADLTAAVPGLVLKEAVFSAPGPGQQAEISVDGTFEGAPLRIAGTATQPDNFGAHVPIPVAISAQAASASLSARGTVPSAFAGGGFDLTVNLRAPSLQELAPLAARPLPDIRNLVLDAHLGDAGFRLRGLHLSDFSFTSSLGDVNGNVTLAWLPVVTLTGTLSAHRFDIDAARDAAAMLMAPPPDAAPAPAPVPPPAPPPVTTPAPEPAQASTEPPPPPRLIPDTKLPFGALRGADANLTLNADRITAMGETFSDLQAHVQANDGKLIINPLRVTSPQGAIVGAFSLDAGIDPPALSISLRSPSLSAARLVSLLGYAGGATGIVQVDARLSGTGDNPRALAATLTGHLGLTMVDGSVTETLLRAMFANALSTAGVPVGEGSSDVRCFAGRAEIIGGKARIDALSLDTSRLSVDGDGTIDLNDETAALHLRPILRVGGTAVAAPVTVTGPLSALKPALDPVLGGGRVGFTIGGAPPTDAGCISELSLARGGMPGPMPNVQAPVEAQPGKKHKKPIDLLQGLFH